MSAVLESELQGDTVATSLARATLAGNRRIKELGLNLDELTMSVSRRKNGWRIEYFSTEGAPNCRGGGHIFEIDANGVIQRELKGQ
jgi:hypothetical protein